MFCIILYKHIFNLLSTTTPIYVEKTTFINHILVYLSELHGMKVILLTLTLTLNTNTNPNPNPNPRSQCLQCAGHLGSNDDQSRRD